MQRAAFAQLSRYATGRGGSIEPSATMAARPIIVAEDAPPCPTASVGLVTEKAATGTPIHSYHLPPRPTRRPVPRLPEVAAQHRVAAKRFAAALVCPASSVSAHAAAETCPSVLI
jgi:hypothetical protein